MSKSASSSLSWASWTCADENFWRLIAGTRVAVSPPGTRGPSSRGLVSRPAPRVNQLRWTKNGGLKLVDDGATKRSKGLRLVRKDGKSF